MKEWEPGNEGAGFSLRRSGLHAGGDPRRVDPEAGMSVQDAHLGRAPAAGRALRSEHAYLWAAPQRITAKSQREQLGSGTWRQDNGGSGLWAKGLRELALWSLSLLNSPLSSHGYELDPAPSIRASLVTPPGFLPLVSTFSNLP